jgi:hypothetical protein
MDIFFTNKPMLAQAITAYQNFENNVAPFALAVLNICLPNATKREVDKIVENNFRDEKDQILMKNGKYYILMKDTTIKAAERAVNRLKAKLGLISRNLRCLKNTKRIQASAFILGTSMVTKSFEFKYVDLAPYLNFVSKKTHSIPFGFKEYLKCSATPKVDNHPDNPMVNIIA